jgi:putative addiction module killer protein
MHTVDAVRVSYGGQSASYGVQCSVFEVKRTQEFDEWLKALPDRDGAARIDACLARLALGSFGDHKPISKGLSELKIDVGPGYRVY